MSELDLETIRRTLDGNLGPSKLQVKALILEVETLRISVTAARGYQKTHERERKLAWKDRDTLQAERDRYKAALESWQFWFETELPRLEAPHDEAAEALAPPQKGSE